MSALRIPGPDGHTILRIIDDGAVGRVSYSRLGIRGGGPPVITGALVTGVSNREAATRQTREYKARQAEKAR